jgi:hypothetical protein
MAFDFPGFLGKLKGTTTFKVAQELAFQKIGEEIDKHANDPAAIKAIGATLRTDAPAIVDAIVQGTEAQHLAPSK